MLLDQDERYAATEACFFRNIDADRRTAIATRYGATHALILNTEKGVNQGAYDWIARHGELLVTVGDYQMYSLELGAKGATRD